MSATVETGPPPEFQPGDELLTIPEFAARIKRSKVSVYKSIQRGKMPPGSVVYIPNGGAMRINWTVYARFVRNRGT